MKVHGEVAHRECAVIMPAYNEQEALPAVIEEWSTVAGHIGGTLVVLNDGSRDGTLDVLIAAQERYENLIVIDKPNSGHGPSCTVGYRWAAEQGFKWIFQTDSDGQTNSAEFHGAWEQRNDADFIFGYRPTRGDGFLRHIISRVLRDSIRIIFGVFVRDANVPFRLMKATALKPFLDAVPSDLFLGNAYIAVLLEKYGGGIHWIPISFVPRTGGVPSVSMKKFVKVGLKVVRDFIGMRGDMKQRFG